MSNEEMAKIMVEICDEYGIPYTRNVKKFMLLLKEAIEKREVAALS